MPPSRGRERRESIGGREMRGDERDREIQSLPSMTFPSGCHYLIALVLFLIFLASASLFSALSLILCGERAERLRTSEEVAKKKRDSTRL